MKASKISSSILAAGLAVACVAGVTACSSSSNSNDGAVAATVNGTSILESDVTASIENIRANSNLTDTDTWGQFLVDNGLTPSSVREEMIDSYIQQALMEQGAADKGVTVDDSDIDYYVNAMKANYDSDEAWTNALSEAGYTEEKYRETIKGSLLQQKLLQQFQSEAADPDEDTLSSYAAMYAQYFSGAKKSSHILFAADDTATAQSVLDQINSGQISFEDAAKQYSTDTASAADGGNVGWDKLNSFVTEYTDALASLDKGQVSGLVTSSYGIHIIKCTDVYTAPTDTTVTFADLPSEFQDALKSMLKSSTAQTAFQQWLSDLKDAADIKINDMPSDVSYNVDTSKYTASTTSSSTDTSTDASSTDASTSTDSSTGSSADASSSASSAAASTDTSTSSSESTDASASSASSQG